MMSFKTASVLLRQLTLLSLFAAAMLPGSFAAYADTESPRFGPK